MSIYSILIVDDEVLTLNNLRKALEQDEYEIFLADSGEKALEIINKNKPHIVLLDLMLPGIDGIEVLKKIKENEEEIIVIMMTAYEIFEKAIEAMKIGAYDYLLKPFKISELRHTIQRALETLSLKIKVLEHYENERGKYYFGKIIAESQKMKDAITIAKKVSLSDKTTVLLQGESGTGKELLAKAIHYHSQRAENPIVEINCATIPENLMESELFGYEPGAFTDAKKRKEGLIETADKGTLFLDEIADLPLNLQAKLLKVLEESTFTRLGGNKPIKVDIRIIAATNKNLYKETELGNFREDLFYRLNVVPITIPPLRERIEDIIPLTLYFIQELNKELKKSFKGISKEASLSLINYPWPGNVRELRNIIERIMSLHTADEILLSHLPVEIRNYKKLQKIEVIDNYDNSTHFITLEELENLYIEKVLQFTNYNKTQAAKILGIHPTSLFRKLKRKKEIF